MEQPLNLSNLEAGRDADSPRLEMDTAPAPVFSLPARQTGAADGEGLSLADTVHLLDYVKILHKRRWVAMTGLLVVLGLVLLYTFTRPVLYQARAQVMIENQDSNVVDFEQVVEENRQSSDYYQTQYRLLQSRALARRALDATKLWDHALFNPTPANPTLVTRFTSWVYGVWPIASAAPSETPAPDETAAQSGVIDSYLARLRITPVRNSRLVDVGFIATDAEAAALFANAHAAAYIDQNLEFKFLASKEATDWLALRMGEQRKQVEGSEQALQNYREQTGAVSLEDRQNIVVQRLADLNAAVTRARTERISREAVYNQARELEGDRGGLDTFPSILNNGFIQQMKGELAQLQRQRAQMGEKLLDRHPEMEKIATAIELTERRMAAEVQKVVQALRNDYQAALANERSLAAVLEQHRQEAQDLNRVGIQYGALQRDAQSNRDLFQSLLQRTKETDISSDLRTNNIRVVDAAEPPRGPYSPNRRNHLLFGLMSGLLIGTGLAFLSEYMDDRIKSPHEIKSFLGLPCLGIIPIIPNDKENSDPMVSRDVPALFAEAVKTIRTNLLFSTTEEAAKTVVVTSTGPGEGKTVVAANIAISMAQAGNRVLLMDCDMRRPRVHDMFAFKQEPGLSNVMVGNAKASDAVRKTTTQNLWVLTAGKYPPNPAELLGSKRFGEFLRNLGEHFEWIIIDSPPVMAVTDAAVVVHRAHGVVFVVGAEMTQRTAARHAIEQLESAKANFFGAVLNRVDLQNNSYYYSEYYRREYSNYYQQERARS